MGVLLLVIINNNYYCVTGARLAALCFFPLFFLSFLLLNNYYSLSPAFGCDLQCCCCPTPLAVWGLRYRTREARCFTPGFPARCDGGSSPPGGRPPRAELQARGPTGCSSSPPRGRPYICPERPTESIHHNKSTRWSTLRLVGDAFAIRDPISGAQESSLNAYHGRSGAAGPRGGDWFCGSGAPLQQGILHRFVPLKSPRSEHLDSALTLCMTGGGSFGKVYKG